MKYLLDTHIILWAALDVKRLSRKAKTILENPENVLYFSPISLWEVSIKHAKHPQQMAIGSGLLPKSRLLSLEVGRGWPANVPVPRGGGLNDWRNLQ